MPGKGAPAAGQTVNQKISLEESQKILLELLQRPENAFCADCGAKGPRWASANLGLFVCIKCSGIHRSLGTHISKVRSVTLDMWIREHLKIMQEVGNAKGAEIWEGNLPDNFRRPTDQDSYALEQFIRAKYERKAFYRKSGQERSSASNASSAPKPTRESTATTTKQQAKPKQTNAQPLMDLLTMDSGASDEFSGFQGASDFISNTTHTVDIKPSMIHNRTHPNHHHHNNNQSSNIEDIFFSGGTGNMNNSSSHDHQQQQQQQQQQHVKPSKESILQLYSSPVLPSTTSAPMMGNNNNNNRQATNSYGFKNPSVNPLANQQQQQQQQQQMIMGQMGGYHNMNSSYTNPMMANNMGMMGGYGTNNGMMMGGMANGGGMMMNPGNNNNQFGYNNGGMMMGGNIGGMMGNGVSVGMNSGGYVNPNFMNAQKQSNGFGF